MRKTEGKQKSRRGREAERGKVFKKATCPYIPTLREGGGVQITLPWRETGAELVVQLVATPA